MGIADIIARVFPLTVGNGTPQYRTNPSTGQKYTFQELKALAQSTSTTYSMPNIYIGETPHAYDVQG